MARLSGLEHTFPFPNNTDNLFIVLEPGPAVERAKHPKGTAMPVPLPGGVVAFEGPDNVSDVGPVGGILDTQIPVFEAGAQAI